MEAENENNFKAEISNPNELHLILRIMHATFLVYDNFILKKVLTIKVQLLGTKMLYLI